MKLQIIKIQETIDFYSKTIQDKIVEKAINVKIVVASFTNFYAVKLTTDLLI